MSIELRSGISDCGLRIAEFRDSGIKKFVDWSNSKIVEIVEVVKTVEIDQIA
jgi:hypothetical protein